MKRIREHFKAVRAELKAMFAHSIYDAAHFNGLAIEYVVQMPPKYTACLDPHDQPAYIAVNSDMPEEERIYVIAREISRYLLRYGRESLLVNRPWKRKLLATASCETVDFIHSLDVEARTFWILYWHSTTTFSQLHKNHPRTYWMGYYWIAASDFLFWKLRIRNAVWYILSRLGFAKFNLALPST